MNADGAYVQQSIQRWLFTACVANAVKPNLTMLTQSVVSSACTRPNPASALVSSSRSGQNGGSQSSPRAMERCAAAFLFECARLWA